MTQRPNELCGADATRLVRIVRTISSHLPSRLLRLRSLVALADLPRLGLPNRFALARFVLGRSLLQQGRADDALGEFRRAMADAKGSPFILAGVGIAAAIAGHDKDATVVLTDLEAAARTRFVSPFFSAKINAALGRDDEAIDGMSEANRLRSGGLGDLAVDPELDGLRGHPGFPALVQQVGLGT